MLLNPDWVGNLVYPKKNSEGEGKNEGYWWLIAWTHLTMISFCHLWSTFCFLNTTLKKKAEHRVFLLIPARCVWMNEWVTYLPGDLCEIQDSDSRQFPDDIKTIVFLLCQGVIQQDQMFQEPSPGKPLKIWEFGDSIVGEDQGRKIGEVACEEFWVDLGDAVIAEEESLKAVENWEVWEGSDVVVCQVQRIVQVLLLLLLFFGLFISCLLVIIEWNGIRWVPGRWELDKWEMKCWTLLLVIFVL